MAENSSSQPGASSSPPGGTVAAMQAQIQQMQSQLEVLRQANSRGRRQMVVVTVVIIVVILGIFYAGFETMRGHFSEEEVKRAMLQPAMELRREVTDRAFVVVKNVAPTYQKLAMERMEKVGPELADQALAQLKKVPDDLSQEMLKILGESFNRVAKRSEADLKTTFPEFKGDGSDKMLQTLAEKVNGQTDIIKKKFNDRLVNETENYKLLLMKFDLPPEAKDPKKTMWDLQRQFLHTLVQIVDYEIMTSGEDEKANAAVPADR